MRTRVHLAIDRDLESEKAMWILGEYLGFTEEEE